MYTSDPRFNPEAQLLHRIESGEIPEEIWAAAGGTNNGLGTGGMVTKLQAADMARRGGTTVVIACGSQPENILKITAGEAVGTWFDPILNSLEARKRYILAGKGKRGVILVDTGAAKALKKGSSLLPAGIASIQGDFDRGDTVHIATKDNHELALGIANYSSRDLLRCIGKKSGEIETVLGYSYGDEAIHRNNLVML